VRTASGRRPSSPARIAEPPRTEGRLATYQQHRAQPRARERRRRRRAIAASTRGLRRPRRPVRRARRGRPPVAARPPPQTPRDVESTTTEPIVRARSHDRAAGASSGARCRDDQHAAVGRSGGIDAGANALDARSSAGPRARSSHQDERTAPRRCRRPTRKIRVALRVADDHRRAGRAAPVEHRGRARSRSSSSEALATTRRDVRPIAAATDAPDGFCGSRERRRSPGRRR
jgi:hypothetical protein